MTQGLKENVVVTTKDSEQVLRAQDIIVRSPSLSTETCTVFNDTEELSATHRPLREKARGQMSEFERQYPW